MHVRTNDTVKVIAGKDRGKQGKVLQVFPQDDLVVVEGVNQIVRHARSQKGGETGQRIEVNGPIHISNIMVVSEQSGKPVRAGKARAEAREGQRKKPDQKEKEPDKSTSKSAKKS